jgi:flagellum-specific peptidoglycan hydrolase FlgJ
MLINQLQTQKFQKDKTVLTVNTTSQVNSTVPSLMHQFVQSIGAPSGKATKKMIVENILDFWAMLILFAVLLPVRY